MEGSDCLEQKEAPEQKKKSKFKKSHNHFRTGAIGGYRRKVKVPCHAVPRHERREQGWSKSSDAEARTEGRRVRREEKGTSFLN